MSEKPCNNGCCVQECYSRKGKNREISFHYFPKETSCLVEIVNETGSKETVNLRTAWKRKLLKEEPIKFLQVCSLHFSPTDYNMRVGGGFTRNLKRNAVPSRNLPIKFVPVKMEFKECGVNEYTDEKNEINGGNKKLGDCLEHPLCEIKTEFVEEEIKIEYDELNSSHSITFQDFNGESVGKLKNSLSRLEETTNSERKNISYATLVCKENRPYPCDLCDIRFKFQDTLIEHKRRCHTDKQLKRDSSITSQELNEHCEASTKSKTTDNSAKESLSNYDKERPFTCDFCPFRFKFEFSLIAHKSTSHVGEQSEEGKHVNKETEDRNEEADSKPVGLFPYNCETCGKFYETEKGLSVHNRIDHGVGKPYECNLCPEFFTLERSLMKHKMLIHDEKAPYKCDVCHKVFTTKGNLKTHSEGHSDYRRYICEICGKGFRFMTLFRAHMATHSDRRPYLCETCGMGFKIKNQLSMHKTIHTGLKPYRCEFCDKQFRTKSHLVAHKKVHSEEKPYKCIVCNKEFRMRCNLKLHSKKHSLE